MRYLGVSPRLPRLGELFMFPMPMLGFLRLETTLLSGFILPCIYEEAPRVRSILTLSSSFLRPSIASVTFWFFVLSWSTAIFVFFFSSCSFSFFFCIIALAAILILLSSIAYFVRAVLAASPCWRTRFSVLSISLLPSFASLPF